MSLVLEQLEKLEDSKMNGIAMLIRHGARGEISKGTYGTDVPLSGKGVAESIVLGERLSRFRIGVIYTSPIGRCVQTAECIKKGMGTAGSETAICLEDQLGNPGFHIADVNEAGKAYLQYGCIGVYERFSRGERVEGLAWLREKTRGKGMAVFVTHDALIANFALANGLRSYSAENWVGFLDGILIDFSDCGVENGLA